MKNILNAGVVLLISGLIFSAAYFSHVSSVKNDFVMDDLALIVFSDFTPYWENVRLLVGRDFIGAPFGVESGSRPLTLISLMLDHRVWKDKGFGFHFTNLVFHGLNSVLVFLLALLLAKGVQAKETQSDGSLAFNGALRAGSGALFYPALAGLVFALHPLQAEAVNVPGFRGDLLGALLYLVSLVLLILANRSKPLFSIPAYFVGFAVFSLGLFAKEIVVTLPAVFIVYMLVFEREKYGVRLIAVAAVLALLSAGFLIFFWSKYFSYEWHRIFYFNIAGSVSPLSSLTAYVNTVLMSFLHQVKMLLMPVNLSCDYLIELPGTIFSIRPILAVALIAVVIWVFVKSRDGLFVFGTGLLAVTYLPVSNIIPLANTVADRYSYLPMAGFAIIFAAALARIPSRYSWKGISAGALIAVAALMLYSTATHARNTVFKNMYLLYSDAVKKYPGNARAHYNLALEYIKQKEMRSAIGEFDKAIVSSPLFKRNDIWLSKAQCYEVLGDTEQAKNLYVRAIMMRPSREAIRLYADMCWRNGDIVQAEKLFNMILEAGPDAEAYNNLGVIYAKQKKTGKAAEYFKNAVSVKPDYSEAWFNLVDACEALGDKKRAEQELRKFTEIFKEKSWEYRGGMIYAR